MTTVDKFRAVYAVTLAEARARNPGEYAYDITDLPGVVEKMTAALAKGEAQIGPAVKAAARRIGVRATREALMTYLLGNCPGCGWSTAAVEKTTSCRYGEGCLCGSTVTQ